VDEVARLAERGRERPLPLGRASRDADLEDDQLLEREPLPPGLRLNEVTGTMHRSERVALQRESFALAQLSRERIRDVERERERGIHDAAHRGRGDLLRGRVDRSEVGGRACLVADVVRAGLEPEAAELPAQPDLGSRLQPVGEPRLVEPGDADRGRVVGDPSDDARPPPSTHRALLDVEDAAADHDLLALPELGDRDFVRSRLVPARPVLEHVANGGEAELAELPLRRRGNSGERVETELEALRPQGTRRRRPRPGLVQACKDRLSTGGCHRPRHRAR